VIVELASLATAGVVWLFRHQIRAPLFARAYRRACGELPRRRFRAAAEQDRVYFSFSANQLNGMAVGLRAAGFTELGDIAFGTDGAADVYARVFADAARTTAALIAVSGRPPHPTMLQLFSHRRDDYYITQRARGSHIATPPFEHIERCAYSTAMTAVLARHRELVPADVADQELVQLADLGAVIAELARRHGAIMAWRDAQPVEAMLDADLRAMFGARYAKLTPKQAQRFRAAPPKATVRSRT
jgi:hypothetical protein